MKYVFFYTYGDGISRGSDGKKKGAWPDIRHISSLRHSTTIIQYSTESRKHRNPIKTIFRFLKFGFAPLEYAGFNRKFKKYMRTLGPQGIVGADRSLAVG